MAPEVNGMNAVTMEIRRAIDAGLYYVAVVVTLTLPDVCAALESPTGTTDGARYRAWYTLWLEPLYPEFTANDVWRLRCGVTHQGRLGHPRSQYSRVLFTLPGPRRLWFHNNIVHDALNLDLVTFCEDAIAAVNRWYEEKRDDPNVIANLPRLMRYREGGLPGYLMDIPMIA